MSGTVNRASLTEGSTFSDEENASGVEISPEGENPTDFLGPSNLTIAPELSKISRTNQEPSDFEIKNSNDKLSESDSSQEFYKSESFASASHSEGNACSRMHFLLLNALVRISLEPSVRQRPELLHLLREAVAFDWSEIDPCNFEQVGVSLLNCEIYQRGRVSRVADTDTH